MTLDSLRLRRSWLRWQRPAAAALAGLSALAAVTSLRSGQSEATVPVVVAARGIPAGGELTAADLVVAQWPQEIAPASATADTEGLLGRLAAGPIGAGEPVSAPRTVGPSLLQSAAATGDAVAVVVGLPEEADMGLFRPGDRVDVLGDSGDRARQATLCTNCAVLAASQGRVVLAVPAPDAPAIAAAQAVDGVTLALRPPP